MKSPTSIPRPLQALGFGIALASASLSAQTVPAIRAQLALGNYKEAVTAANATLAASGTSDGDLADSRFYRAYARLLDSAEREGASFAQKIGATNASIDLFMQEVDVNLPEVLVYARTGDFAPFVKSTTSNRFALPKGFDPRPTLSFTNNATEALSVSLSVNTGSYWGAILEDTANGTFAELYGAPGLLDVFSETLTLEANPDIPSFSFFLDPSQRLDLRVYFNDDNLKFTLAPTSSALVAGVVSPFTRSGNSFNLKSDYRVPEPALSFENQGLTPYSLVLDFGASSSFGLNVSVDGRYSGYVYADNGELSGYIDELGVLSGNTLVVTLEPKSALTLTAYRASSDFAVQVVGTLPKTVLAKNGSHVVGKYPKFAPRSNSALVFTTLASLDASTLTSVVADLSAIPASHENRLSTEESIQRREIVIQHPDRQAAIALLKFVQAFGLLGKTIDLGFDFSTPGFYDDLDPIAFLSSSKTLLGAGKASPADRTRFRNLLSEMVDHTFAALDSGIQTRPAPVDAEYLFALGSGPENPLIVADAGSYRFTSQVAYDGNQSIAFRNTTGADKTLVLRFEGKPTTPEYFSAYSSWLESSVSLTGAENSYLSAESESLTIGRYDGYIDYETFDYIETFIPFGSLNAETSEWTVTLPAYSVLRFDFHLAAADARLTPVSSLPSGVQAVIGQSAIEEADFRSALTDFKTALTGSIPASRLGLDDLPPGATVSLAPLFAAKPFNPRAALPKIGQNGVLRGDSARFLGSGFLGQVSVTGWENFLDDKGSLDLVTPPKITPLKITTQPAGADLTKGASHTLSVVADGYPVPTYQWLKNGVAIEGATLATLTLSDVTSLDIASYQVRLVGGANTSAKPLLSAAAKVTVKDAPIITTAPALANTLVPASKVPVTLSVQALGYAPLRYQWFKNGVAIPKATAAKLVLPATIASDGSYHVVVTNAYGSATSENEPVSITVGSIVTTGLPATRILNIGQPLNLSITATGLGDLAYQWQKNGEPIEGETGSSFSISEVGGGDIGNYSVVITGEAGTYTSPSVAVSVNLAPKTLAAVGTSLRFTGSGVQGGESYEANREYTITAAGKASVIDNIDGAEGAATYAYKFINSTTAELTGSVSAPAYGFKETQKARLTFTSPTTGSYTATGSDNFDGAFTESGSFEIAFP